MPWRLFGLIVVGISLPAFASTLFEKRLNLPPVKTQPVPSNCSRQLLSIQNSDQFKNRVRELLSLPIPEEHLKILSTKWAELEQRSTQIDWAGLKIKELTDDLSNGDLQLLNNVDNDRSSPSGTLSGKTIINLMGVKDSEGDLEERKELRRRWKKGEMQVFQWANRGIEPTSERIMEIYQILSGSQRAFRQNDMSVIYPYNKMTSGDTVVPEFNELFSSWFLQNKNQLHPILLAAGALRRFVTVHPFEDANGRVGRLIMDWLLQLHGFPPPTFPTYYGSIMKSTEPVFASQPDNASYSPSTLVEFITLGIEQTIQTLENHSTAQSHIHLSK